MSEDEFEAINARQDWLNRTIISKTIKQINLFHPLKVLDVGCGTGTSTTILASYLPEGSVIWANDITPKFVLSAAKKFADPRNHNLGKNIWTYFYIHNATQPVDQDPVLGGARVFLTW